MALSTHGKEFILAGPRHGIRVTGAEDISSFLFDLIPQWPLLRSQDTPASENLCPIRIEKSADRWRISSPHLAPSRYDLRGGYTLANALIGALIAAYVAQGENLVSIHAGAVRVGDGLVLLLGDNGSGKSTFATLLAAMGQRCFADDRLILDLQGDVPNGLSLAIAPKVRLPLPEEATAVYGEFVDQYSILVQPGMAVLRPGPDRAADFGDRLPIKALVHLDRDNSADQATLTAMRQPPMVRILLEQLSAPHLNQQGELAACVALAGSVDSWQLRYHSAFSAADMLLSHFADGAGRDQEA